MSQGMDRIVNVQIIAPLLGSFWLVIALTVLLATANLKEKNVTAVPALLGAAPTLVKNLQFGTKKFTF